MTRTNLTIGYPVRTIGALAGGSWEASRPLSRVNVLPLADVARTTDAVLASTAFTATLDAQRPVACVGLSAHNISIAGQVRIELLDSGGTVLADSGWVDAWPPIYAPFGLDWGEPSFMTLRPEQSSIDGEIATFVHLFSQSYITTDVRVSIDDTDNPDGFIEIGFFQAAGAQEMAINLSYGAREGFDARSLVQVSQGGVRTVERRNKPRILQGEIVMTTDDRRSLINAMHRERDLELPFLIVQEPSETLFKPLTQWLAVFSELSPGERAFFGYDRQTLRLEQVL